MWTYMLMLLGSLIAGRVQESYIAAPEPEQEPAVTADARTPEPSVRPRGKGVTP